MNELPEETDEKESVSNGRFTTIILVLGFFVCVGFGLVVSEGYIGQRCSVVKRSALTQNFFVALKMKCEVQNGKCVCNASFGDPCQCRDLYRIEEGTATIEHDQFCTSCTY